MRRGSLTTMCRPPLRPSDRVLLRHRRGPVWPLVRLRRRQIPPPFTTARFLRWLDTANTVIADELLRSKFGAQRGHTLPEDSQKEVSKAVRQAWQANPGGAAATAKRWAKKQLQDDFAICMQKPDWKALLDDPSLSNSDRIDLVRSLFELAILHSGDIKAAEDALDELKNGEIPAFGEAITPLWSDPKIPGLPALCLWLRLLKRRLSIPEQLPKDVDEYLISVLEQARRLCRQVELVYSHPEPLRAVLHDALAAVLPPFSRAALPAAANARFRASAVWLNQQLAGGSNVLEEIRCLIVKALALKLIAFASPPAGEPERWAKTLIELLEDTDTHAATFNSRELNYGTWTVANVENSLSGVWGNARTLSFILGSLTSADADRTVKLADQMSVVVQGYPDHDGIQLEYAQAWRYVTGAFKDINVVRCRKAAQLVRDIAQNFPNHEDIQHEYAQAWQYVTWATWKIDAAHCEKAAQVVREIAQNFPNHEGIQFEYAQAWRNFACKNFNLNPAHHEKAAQVVREIAQKFPNHEGIQFEYAQAWGRVAMMNSLFANDADRCEKAAQAVREIAQNFPNHGGIQFEYAMAWKNVTAATMELDAEHCENAAQVVREIAQNFPNHEGIQFEYAQAWRNFACKKNFNLNPAHYEKAAQVVREIAQKFPSHEGIQFEHAIAWRYVTGAYTNIDAAHGEKAAQVVREIAQNFPNHEGIQLEYAIACRYVTAAAMNVDAARCEKAAQVVREIAQNSPNHKGIQFEYAQAWQYVAWANRNIDAAHCEKAAQVVSKVAQNFPNHEGIRVECAIALRCVVESAVKFDDKDRIKKTLLAIDRLTGQVSGTIPLYAPLPQKITSGVLQERALAYATYGAWRKAKAGYVGGE